MSNRKNILLAPNGKPSNLNEEQYYLVRTPEFKQWFGDWEKLAMAKVQDPAIDEVTLANLSKDVSKVVDQNGEPLVVYHATFDNFNIFSKQEFNEKESLEWYNKNTIRRIPNGFYFTDNKEASLEFAIQKKGGKINEQKYLEDVKVLSVFLNIKKPDPIYLEEQPYYLPNLLKEYPNITSKLKDGKTDGLISQYGYLYLKSSVKVVEGWEKGEYMPEEIYGREYIVLNSNQIKLADGTNTTFDGSNPDIRFDDGGGVDTSFVHWTNRNGLEGIFESGVLLEESSITNNLELPFDSDNNMPYGIILKPSISKYSKKVGSIEGVTELESLYEWRVIEDIKIKDFFDGFVVRNNTNKERLEKYLDNNHSYWNDFLNYYKNNGYNISIVKNTKYVDGGLIAPNGKKSNLTAEQYKLVRTKAFKDWFGDWENDPANASKVVDENGEPLVVYHGTFREFNVFEWSKDGGFYFTEFSRIAEMYSISVQEGKLTKTPNENPIVLKCFLNFRNPLRERIYGVVGKNKRLINVATKKGYDSLIISGGQDLGGYYDQYVAIQPNQIKLADGSNKTFDGSNPDIRFDDGGKLFNNGGNMKNIGHGGITYGESHANGGIKVQNKSTGEMLEVEGGEGVVNKRSMASDKMVKLNGKQMSICEAVSKLNEMEGGVKFSCDDVKHKQFIEEMALGGELERGIRTEKEHIATLIDIYNRKYTPEQATEMIAKDHLQEDPYYYSKLAKIENTSGYNPMVYVDKEEDEITQMIKEQQRKKFERELIMARGGMTSCGCSHHKKYDDGGKTDCGCSDYVKSLPRPKLENGAFIDFSGKDLPKFTGDVTNKPTSIGGLIDIKGQAEANKPNEREQRNAERFKIVLSRAEELLNKDYLPVLKDSQQTKYLNKYLEPYKSLNLYKLGWRFTINTDAESVGLCEYNRAKEKNKQKRNLYLSYRYIIGDDNFINEMDSVILHEISHAIVAEIFFLNEFELDTTQIREVDLKGVVAQVNKFDLIDPQHEVTKGHGVTWANVCIALTGGYICRMFYEYAIKNEQINPFMYKCIKCGTEDFGDSRSFAKVCKKCSTPVLIVKHFK